MSSALCQIAGARQYGLRAVWQLAGNGNEARTIAPDHNDVGTGAGQRRRNRGANATAGPRHECPSV